MLLNVIESSAYNDCKGMQASTDTEPRRDRGQQGQQSRPRTSVGSDDNKFDFGKFVRGDLPGKLGMMLVSLGNLVLAELFRRAPNALSSPSLFGRIGAWQAAAQHPVMKSLAAERQLQGRPPANAFLPWC